MTTIEIITLDGKPIFRHRDTRHLSERDIRELVREGRQGVDKSQTLTIINNQIVPAL